MMGNGRGERPSSRQQGMWTNPDPAKKRVQFPAQPGGCGTDFHAAAADAVPPVNLVRGLTSVIVIAHNRRDLSERCVRSVLRHTVVPYELILVDNGSTDGSGRFFAEVARRHSHVRCLSKPKNFGVYARTFGMQVARGEYMCWLDNDVEVGEGWLEPLVKAMADPAVGGAGNEGVVLTADWQHRFHTRHWPSGQAHRQPVDILVSYCVLFRNLVHYIGFLDPGFHPFWNEEADYSLRVKLLGYRLVVVPVNVTHHAHGTGLNLLRDRNDHIARMNRRLIEKWEPFKHRVLEIYREG